MNPVLYIVITVILSCLLYAISVVFRKALAGSEIVRLDRARTALVFKKYYFGLPQRQVYILSRIEDRIDELWEIVLYYPVPVPDNPTTKPDRSKIIQELSLIVNLASDIEEKRV